MWRGLRFPIHDFGVGARWRLQGRAIGWQLDTARLMAAI